MIRGLAALLLHRTHLMVRRGLSGDDPLVLRRVRAMAARDGLGV